MILARPVTNPDQSSNLLRWQCSIPGSKGTNWDGGRFTLTMDFPESFPDNPPKIKFVPPLFHPNVYSSGTVCQLDDEDWEDIKTASNDTGVIGKILTGIQFLLDNPNINSPQAEEPYSLYVNNREQYNRRIRDQAKRHHDEYAS